MKKVPLKETDPDLCLKVNREHGNPDDVFTCPLTFSKTNELVPVSNHSLSGSQAIPTLLPTKRK